MKRSLKKTPARKREGQSEPDLRELMRKASEARKKSLADLMRIEKESRQRSRELDKRLAALTPPAWPTDLILKARELAKSGKFKKRIIKRTPVDIDTDSAELECGHTTRVFFTCDDHDTRECLECRNNWLKRHAKKAKR
jgi:hypothetical protein